MHKIQNMMFAMPDSVKTNKQNREKEKKKKLNAKKPVKKSKHIINNRKRRLFSYFAQYLLL